MKSLLNTSPLRVFILGLFLLIPQMAVANVLINKNNLVYEGSFRVPVGKLGGDSKIWSMGRGGRGITYNPSNNSLILVGSSHEKLAVEISIPVVINSDDINDLNTAVTVQSPGDITGGTWNNLNTDGSAVTNGGVPGGFLVYGGKLIGNAYAYYATGESAHLSHFTASLTWATNGANFSGFKRVGINPESSENSNGGWTGGFMCTVPSAWQTRLGYPALTGNGAIPIISRSSYGPSVWGFDPANIGVTDPVPAQVFFGYPSAHQTLGTYSGASLYYNMATGLAGMVFPDGSDSILVFGNHGLGFNGIGDGCYGNGTSDPTLHLTPSDDGSHYCYDPVDSSKGGHAYPYVYQVWAYDANDMLDVKNGTKQYWEITPYAIWNFNLPFAVDDSQRTGKKVLGGVAYDPHSQRIFISQIMSDYWADQYEPNPIIHVFRFDLGGSCSTCATPFPPSNFISE